MNQLNKFLKKCEIIHGDKYDYSKVEYINAKTKVCIICPKHGEFWQKPHQHIVLKRGCAKCGNETNGMKRQLGTSLFITKAKEIHGDKYDYSKVEYVNNNTKVCIICPKHGEFWQTPKTHLRSLGCPKCTRENASKERSKDSEWFINKSQIIHGDKYDYSKVKYINANKKVCIICPKHGEFWQTSNMHFNGQGCPKCTKEDITCKQSIENAKLFWDKITRNNNSNLNFDKTQYVNSRTKICVTCKKHGDFFVLPMIFTKRQYCPKCKQEQIEQEKNKKALNLELLQQRKKQEKIKKFIEKSQSVHGDKYDYSKVEYINKQTKVCIICPEHGEFWQKPHFHMKGCKCPKCALNNIKLKLSWTTEQFITKAKEIHGDKYDYSKVEYVNNNTKVCIICPKHGEFWQTPNMHLNEHQGCPLCGTLSSKSELEIFNFLKEKCDDEIVLREHQLIPPQEIDIFLPSKSIAIEFDGLRWHSELFNKNKWYHLNKSKKCLEQGVHLIHVFEDEWVYKRQIVEHKLLHLLRIDVGKSKIYGRKCMIKEIQHLEGNKFLDEYHIQGKCISSVILGAFYEGILIGVMSFLKSKNDNWILNRFATNYNYICNGVGGKLFQYFLQNYSYNKIITFADRRWTLDDNFNFYTKLGFKLDGILPPNYSYVSSTTSYRKRIHKFNCRKQLLNKKYGLPLSMTEEEMAKELKLYKIWDCGLYRYIYTNPNLDS